MRKRDAIGIHYVKCFSSPTIRISSHPGREYRAGTEQSGIAAASANVVRAIGQAMLPAIGLDSCQGPVCSLVEGHAMPVGKERGRPYPSSLPP